MRVSIRDDAVGQFDERAEPGHAHALAFDHVRHRAIGRPESRVDGRLKVTGEAAYPADVPIPHAAYAHCVTSAIACGRIVRIDATAARTLPGVLAIYTHEEMRRRLAPTSFGLSRVQPLQDDRVWHQGQIIAIVVAETFEIARDAAQRVRVDYAEEGPPAGVFDAARADTRLFSEFDPSAPPQAIAGDIATALASADAVIDAMYETSPQHHNAMELHSTTCAWSGNSLTIHQPTGWVYATKHGVAQQLGIDPSRVTAISTFVGGSFGGKGPLVVPTSIIALAAQALRRPVKLVMTRRQIYAITGHRTETRHHIRLAAQRSGKLIAFGHETWEVTSRSDVRSMNGSNTSARIYGWTCVHTRRHLVRLDRNTPGSMRSPPEVPVMFALESALDEMAHTLRIDPVVLRRMNDTQVDPIDGKPYTSRSLIECYAAGAEAFGWAQRDPEPGSMRDGDWQIGWGCATAIYPTYAAPASARVRVGADGHVVVQVAAHEIGTGAYTILAQIAADRLGVPLGDVSVELGDSRLPPAPYAGGSMTTATVGSAVSQACDAIRARLGVEADGDVAAKLASMRTGAVEEVADWTPAGAKEDATREAYTGRVNGSGGVDPDALKFAFGAQFVEVRVNRRTCEIRVPRALGAYAAGRIINPKTARSQLMGGMIWGISCALFERTEVDPATARYLNADLAEYLVPVNADVGRIDVILVPEVDTRINALGAKGIGELGNVGMDAAVANAIFHATGRRIRKLPIRIEHLLPDTP
jgi:xanthine dehydrogenase YagR molybdenum-binding subunit